MIDFNSDKRVNDLGKNILLSEYKNQLDELAKTDIDIAILKAQRDNEIFEVLIKNGVVDIYLNPSLDKKDIINLIIDNYNLTSRNGIKKIRIHRDCSDHYKCHLDK